MVEILVFGVIGLVLSVCFWGLALLRPDISHMRTMEDARNLPEALEFAANQPALRKLSCDICHDNALKPTPLQAWGDGLKLNPILVCGECQEHVRNLEQTGSIETERGRRISRQMEIDRMQAESDAKWKRIYETAAKPTLPPVTLTRATPEQIAEARSLSAGIIPPGMPAPALNTPLPGMPGPAWPSLIQKLDRHGLLTGPPIPMDVPPGMPGSVYQKGFEPDGRLMHTLAVMGLTSYEQARDAYLAKPHSARSRVMYEWARQVWPDKIKDVNIAR